MPLNFVFSAYDGKRKEDNEIVLRETVLFKIAKLLQVIVIRK